MESAAEGGLMGRTERVRCAIYWPTYRAPLCPRWAAIVPVDKGLIQHILSLRESSGNWRRRPSPQSYAPTPPMFLSPSLWLVTRQWQCIKGNCRTMQEASQEFEEPFFKKKKQEFHMADFCRILWGPSRQLLEPQNTRTKHWYLTVTQSAAWLSNRWGKLSHRFLCVSPWNIESAWDLSERSVRVLPVSMWSSGLIPESRNMHTFDCRL